MTLVCYDITSNRLRRQIDKCMKDFGTRLQFSVFMCWLDADGVEHCREKLQKVLKNNAKERMPDDSVIIFERIQPYIAENLLGTRIESELAQFRII
jgi:CRISPR-associated endonuclease Cas2